MIEQDLIERLEQSTMPDRMLDHDIFECVHMPALYAGSKINSWSRGEGRGYTVNTADGYRHLCAFAAPNYTAAIDGARLLIPADMFWSIAYGQTRPGEPLGACVLRDAVDYRKVVSEAEAPTVEVAICIAALKARLAGHPRPAS